MEINIERLRNDVRMHLLTHGITQRVLSEKVGMTEANISAFLNGNQSLANHRVASFCEFIGVDVGKYVDSEFD